jgi:putative hydrolase of the HAD superfamily
VRGNSLTQSFKAISLDLDDTLWPSGPALAAAEEKLHVWLEAHAPAVAAALPPPEFAKFRRSLSGELPHIAHDFTELRLEAIKRALAIHREDAGLAESALKVFLEARSEVVLFAEVPEALERLASRYPLIALTNGNADIGRAGVGQFFTGVVTAGSAGVAKPDPRIFHAVCSTQGLLPQAVLHAGDHPEADVRGAARAGLRAAWINRSRTAWTGEAEVFHEFSDLTGLCEWLGI